MTVFYRIKGMPDKDIQNWLNPERAARARELLPAADLRLGDAVALPWEADTFQLVVASTLFTSVLDNQVRRMIAGEIVRVLAPGGAPAAGYLRRPIPAVPTGSRSSATQTFSTS